MLEQPAAQKYIACNADEGDSGTFADRMLMEGDPFCPDRRHDHRGRSRSARRRATSICACEYPHAHRALVSRDRGRVRQGYLGDECARQRQALRSRSPPRRRRVYLRRRNLDAREPRRQARRGARAAAAAGDQGPVRPADRRQQRHHRSRRVPDHSGDSGARSTATSASGRSRGTLPIQLAGNIKHGGLIEQASA